MTTFKTEAQFEQAFIEVLTHKGWENEILKNKTEADLLQNWANILFENNRQQDLLNDVPLTATEMQQIIEQIKELKTPLKLNGLINSKTVAIKRDNPADSLHYGKEVSLKIYDRQEIAAGQSRYQIVQQPKFERGSPLRNERRGDVLLLINGMPVIHVELKRSGIPVSQAVNQIEKYSKEGIFSGLFSLIQVFVAMEPNEAKYFANPGLDGKFNPDYQFHWGDYNNETKANHSITQWKEIASTLLSIPMAHQLIGFYTVADDTDGVLKVMRSYQYYAANAIADKVAKTNWNQLGSVSNNPDRLGGYVWHTTGSGKTMTSFKSAQLISQSKDADKVIFLMDRIELGTQSLAEYRNFAGDGEDVQSTENTHVLVTKLKSTDKADTLIVSSIQKMSNIFEEVDDEGTATNSADIEKIRAKRLVFIIDEAHRSTFGDMLIIIKRTFPSALFFGFTGTPIQDENQKNGNTTSTVFGNELHRYSIADGIRDGNVLGFDPYKVPTFRDSDLRQAVALEQAKAHSVKEALDDPAKKKKFNHFLNDVPMAGFKDATGKYHKGIEDEIPKSQYLGNPHQAKVVEDILDKWDVLSQGSKFHAILATNSIAEAIDYYRLLKASQPDLKVSALFDPNIDNDGGTSGRGVNFKGGGLEEIMADYNARYGQNFDFARHDAFKKDLAARLAHKKPYERIHTDLTKQLDLLIVVDQMLTGFDSKWLNVLYLDKVIKYQHIIQAFSRTNRLFGPDKPHGIIRYYRKPHTMERNINDAIKLYSGDKAIGLFVDKLESNLKKMNELVADITELFTNSGINNFEKTPDDVEACAKFSKQFKILNQHLEAARVQGFYWGESVYTFSDVSEDENGSEHEVTLAIDKQTYLSLVLRYKELAEKSDGNSSTGGGDVPFDISGYLTEIDTGKIDADYMNSRFEKFLKELNQHKDQASIELTLNELHKSFSSLTQSEQKYARLFLHDLQRGDINLTKGYSFRDYINTYMEDAENSKINAIVSALGLDKKLLTDLLGNNVNENNLNDFGRFDALKETVDENKAKRFFEKIQGSQLPRFEMRKKVSSFLTQFVLKGDARIPASYPEPIFKGDQRLYSAEQFHYLENATEIGAINLKTEMLYEEKLLELDKVSDSSEMSRIGVLSPEILDCSLNVTELLENVTRELNIPVYDEKNSGVIWAVRKAKKGSIELDIVAFAVNSLDMDTVKGMTENVIYDFGKVASGAVVKLVYDRTVRVLKGESSLLNKSTSKLRLFLSKYKTEGRGVKDYVGDNIIDFETHPEASVKWGNKRSSKM